MQNKEIVLLEDTCETHIDQGLWDSLVVRCRERLEFDIMPMSRVLLYSPFFGKGIVMHPSWNDRITISLFNYIKGREDLYGDLEVFFRHPKPTSEQIELSENRLSQLGRKEVITSGGMVNVLMYKYEYLKKNPVPEHCLCFRNSMGRYFPIKDEAHLNSMIEEYAIGNVEWSALTSLVGGGRSGSEDIISDRIDKNGNRISIHYVKCEVDITADEQGDFSVYGSLRSISQAYNGSNPYRLLKELAFNYDLYKPTGVKLKLECVAPMNSRGQIYSSVDMRNPHYGDFKLSNILYTSKCLSHGTTGEIDINIPLKRSTLMTGVHMLCDNTYARARVYEGGFLDFVTPATNGTWFLAGEKFAPGVSIGTLELTMKVKCKRLVDGTRMKQMERLGGFLNGSESVEGHVTQDSSPVVEEPLMMPAQASSISGEIDDRNSTKWVDPPLATDKIGDRGSVVDFQHLSMGSSGTTNHSREWDSWTIPEEEVEKCVMECLRSDKNGLHVLSIARSVARSGDDIALMKSKCNRVLYRLAKENKVVALGLPPRWKIYKEPRARGLPWYARPAAVTSE